VRVLAVNPGSTSLKVALVEDGRTVETETVGGDGAGLARVVGSWQPVDAAGVRFVHGGHRHTAPVQLDAGVLSELDEVADLAPLHNPAATTAARDLQKARPDLPVVACFDTTFHVGMPAAAATYALPREWNRRWHLRRYGFHGLSHEYAARRARELAGATARTPLRVVSCHLGGGASLCAVVDGRSVDTTMGFTPLDGLVMQTRGGSLDPGLVLWLLRHGGVGLDELAEVLDRLAGLAGLTGTSGDVREVVEGAERGDADSRLGLDVYLHRVRREVGAMAASAGGVDVLVFTGGVGEHSDVVRRGVCEGLSHLGIELPDPPSERPVGDDRVLTREGAPVAVATVVSREELVIAEQVLRVLSQCAN
jgi:acetate kinase